MLSIINACDLSLIIVIGRKVYFLNLFISMYGHDSYFIILQRVQKVQSILLSALNDKHNITV